MKTLCLGYLAAMTWMLFSTASVRMVRAGAAAYEPLREAMTIGHFLGFAVLSVLTLAPRWRMPRWAIGAALLIAAVGSELLQTMIPGRTPDPADVPTMMSASRASRTSKAIHSTPVGGITNTREAVPKGI